MSNESMFYRRQAEIERANAAGATLDNVRHRSERAAQSWEAMAGRAERTDLMRSRREAARVEADAPAAE